MIHPLGRQDRFSSLKILGLGFQVLLCVALLWGAAPAQAQAYGRWAGLTSVTFRNYSRDQGMPHPVVTTLAQDHDGFIWIGTQGGLTRWDGYRFKSYMSDPSVPRSLPDDWVQTLHVDPVGQLWVGSAAGRVARYDAVHDRFDLVPLGMDSGRTHVGAIIDDGAGGLWIGTDDGLRHLNSTSGAAGTLRADTPGVGGLSGERVQAAVRDRAGTLWVGMSTGLSKRGKSAGGFTAVALDGGKLGVSALFEGEDGRLWIGTVRDGLFVIDRRGGTPRRIGTNAHLPPGTISAIAAAGPHRIWASLRGAGIVSVDAQTGAAMRIQHDRTLSTSLAHDDIWSLFRDSAGSLWAGGTGGLSYHPQDAGLISTVFGMQDRPGSLSSSDVLSIMPTRDGKVWLGYVGGGVDVIDPLRGLATALRPDPARPGRTLPQESVFSMVEGADGRVFIGTRRGLYASTLAAKGVGQVSVRGRDPHLAINALIHDAGVLWIGGEYDGVWGVVPGNTPETLGKVSFGPADAAKLSNPEINVIVRGTGHELWVGTRNGLNRIDLATHAVQPTLADPGNPASLPGRFVSALQVDRQGRLWVGTFGGGLALATGRAADGQLQFRRFGTADGLPHLNVDSLSMDGDGTLWAGTDDGLARIDPVTFAIRAVGAADGSTLRDYFVGARAADPTGEALFGAKDGLTVVRAGLLPPWRFDPRVIVTDLRIGGVSMPVAAYNRSSEAAPIVLTRDTNSLTVEFAALDFTAPERNRYAYRLDGFDRDWIQTDSTRRLAAYTNLPPGDYTLHLRGSNRAGLWSERSLALRVQVLPAWYQWLGFRLAVMALLVLGIAGLVRWRTAYLRRQQGELEHQIAERTADLSAANERLAQLAMVDALTGCANRRHFLERASELINHAGQHDLPICLMAIDLDDFKGINDTWGHPCGDAVLAMTGRIFEQHLRLIDLVGRIGGEEFALLMPQMSAEGARSFAERLRQAIGAASIPIRDSEIRVTASFGVAELRENEDYEGLYTRADAALYAAKQLGRNRVEFWD